jgi:hypothetical protein
MAVATLLAWEMPRVLKSDMEERRMITATSRSSTMTTRSRTEEKIELGAPSMCFAYRHAGIQESDFARLQTSPVPTAKEEVWACKILPGL